MMSMSLRQRLQCLPSLCAGVAAGLLLALITARANRGAEPAVVAWVSLLPFLLAAMTGVAKTTTA
jgi:xanthosine utilization system XapX-like protein